MTEPTEGTTTKQPENPNADGGGAGQGQPAPVVTYSQDQIDEMLKPRLDRARDKAKAELLAELGIEDAATAKKTLAEAEATKKAQMTELEKAQSEIAEAQAQAAKATTDAATIKAQADKALLKAAIISQAGNFNDPMDAWSFIDQTKIEAQEDGTYKGIDEALKELAESKPYLVKAAANGNQGPGTPTRRKPQTIVEKMIAQQQDSTPKPVEELRPNISF